MRFPNIQAINIEQPKMRREKERGRVRILESSWKDVDGMCALSGEGNSREGGEELKRRRG